MTVSNDSLYNYVTIIPGGNSDTQVTKQESTCVRHSIARHNIFRGFDSTFKRVLVVLGLKATIISSFMMMLTIKWPHNVVKHTICYKCLSVHLSVTIVSHG